MRYNELLEAKGWRHYLGTDRGCVLFPLANSKAVPREARVQYGAVSTGKQRVWAGYYFKVVGQDGCEWLAEDPHCLRRALRAIERQLNADGLSLQVIGLDREWCESGLSANSGYGYHPDFDHAVHMLQPAHGSGL